MPPDPVVTTRDLPETWASAGIAACALIAGTMACFAGLGRK